MSPILCTSLPLKTLASCYPLWKVTMRSPVWTFRYVSGQRGGLKSPFDKQRASLCLGGCCAPQNNPPGPQARGAAAPRNGKGNHPGHLKRHYSMWPPGSAKQPKEIISNQGFFLSLWWFGFVFFLFAFTALAMVMLVSSDWSLRSSGLAAPGGVKFCCLTTY